MASEAASSPPASGRESGWLSQVLGICQGEETKLLRRDPIWRVVGCLPEARRPTPLPSK